MPWGAVCSCAARARRLLRRPSGPTSLARKRAHARDWRRAVHAWAVTARQPRAAGSPGEAGEARGCGEWAHSPPWLATAQRARCAWGVGGVPGSHARPCRRLRAAATRGGVPTEGADQGNGLCSPPPSAPLHGASTQRARTAGRAHAASCHAHRPGCTGALTWTARKLMSPVRLRSAQPATALRISHPDDCRTQPVAHTRSAACAVTHLLINTWTSPRRTPRSRR